MFPERIEINIISEIKDIIPGYLCFLVGWRDSNIGRGNIYFDIDWGNNPRGNYFGLYTFDNEQNFVNEYLISSKHFLDSIRDNLMENMPGNKLEYGLVSIGDFNNNGINEIFSIYMYPPLYEYIFTIFEYDILENDLVQTLLVPFQINFDKPSVNIEYIGNGFKILEVLEYDPLELAWNNYIWDNGIGRYIRK
jgi:hypothetical protein